MKRVHSSMVSPSRASTRLVAAVGLAVFTAAGMAADVVYVTSRPQPRGNGPNTDGTYNDNNLGDDSTAHSTAPGVPPVSVTVRW